jgi:predicted hotdog family 3-hydroxylacyl-ACP dehydratase
MEGGAGLPSAILRRELESLLPHKGRMFLLDSVHRWDLAAGTLESEVLVSEGDLFYDTRTAGVPVWVAFEYMAQSISALSGLRRRGADGSEPRFGFIMSVRDFQAYAPHFSPGSRLRVSVRQLAREEDVVSFECAVGENGRIKAKAIVNALEVERLTP